jgi:hypothetical protein
MMVQLINTRKSIDFFDTHSPVTRIISIRVLVPIAVVHNQIDVKVPF